jgi:isocitrate/isopropylmalate dehydrogenase
MLFLYFNSLEQHATVIRNAVVNTIGKHNVKTVDIGGTASTSEFMKVVLDEIQRNTPEIGK